MNDTDERDENDDLEEEEEEEEDGASNYFEYRPMLPLVRDSTTVLQTISPDTLHRALRGDFESYYDDIKVIDCRFPFEYAGGHIDGAHNLYSWDQMRDELFSSGSPTIQQHRTIARTLLVFHCEFSQKRAPFWWSRVRQHDRATRPDAEPNYNQLIYPEMYVMKGGYKAFYENQQVDAQSQLTYRSMLHCDFANECKDYMRAFHREVKPQAE